MKLIDLSQKSGGTDVFHNVIGQINQLFSGVKTGEQAEEAIIARLMRGLDNRFVMLRKLAIEGTKEYFPPILIGPSGLVILNISSAQGIYRAREDSWWEMSKTTHRFNPGRPNLLKQSQAFGEKLASVLDQRGRSHPEIIPILIFANPGTHLEATNPAVRVVLMDGVESLIGALMTGVRVLDADEVNALLNTLEFIDNPETAIPMGEGEDFFGKYLLEPEKKPSLSIPKVKFPTRAALPSVEEKFKFSAKQWLVIEILLVFTIIILIAGILYVLLSY